MKITAKELVIRFNVEFTLEEVLVLRRMGLLPPDCQVPAFLWLTGPELVETMTMLNFPEDVRSAFIKKIRETTIGIK